MATQGNVSTGQTPATAGGDECVALSYPSCACQSLCARWSVMRSPRTSATLSRLSSRVAAASPAQHGISWCQRPALLPLDERRRHGVLSTCGTLATSVDAAIEMPTSPSTSYLPGEVPVSLRIQTPIATMQPAELASAIGARLRAACEHRCATGTRWC